MKKEEKIEKLQKEITSQITHSRELLMFIDENTHPLVPSAKLLRRQVLKEINKNIRKFARLDKNALIYQESWPKEDNNNNYIN